MKWRIKNTLIIQINNEVLVSTWVFISLSLTLSYVPPCHPALPQFYGGKPKSHLALALQTAITKPHKQDDL